MKSLVSPTLADVRASRRRGLSLAGALGLLGVSGLLAFVIEPNRTGLFASVACLAVAVVAFFWSAFRVLEWIEAPGPETTEDSCQSLSIQPTSKATL